MNEKKGVDTKQELEVLKKAGYFDKPGFQQHPKGRYGPDAKTNEGLIEVRKKYCSLSRAALPPWSGAPSGLMLNKAVLDQHQKPFDYIVEDGNGKGYKAILDPKVVRTYPFDNGRDVHHTGKQGAYYIPVEVFTQIY